MEHQKKQTIEISVIDYVECDCCGRKLDEMELQEALRWKNYCGYGSVFGDGSIVTVDICQQCVSRILGSYLEYHDEET